jgi:alpha-glucosidase (family GH31 glycosyl hydrolase)
MNQHLFSKGVDSWWMDATEPENDALHGKKTYLGMGDFYRLTYPLFLNQAIYEGQRQTTQNKRVCILTRSAFAGQQRYGSINWSGDVNSCWTEFCYYGDPLLDNRYWRFFSSGSGTIHRHPIPRVAYPMVPMGGI